MSALHRFTQQLLFRFGIRPAALFVVVACAALVFSLMQVRRATFVASGVTYASSTALSSLVPAKVERVHVALGQRVVEGQLLATLSAPDLESELEEIDARIRRLSRAAQLAQLSLMRGLNSEQRDALIRLTEVQRDTRRALAEEERAATEASAAVSFFTEADKLVKEGKLEPLVASERAQLALRESAQRKAAGALLTAENQHIVELRKKLDETGAPKGLIEATAELYQAELEVLERQRAGLMTRMAALSIKAPVSGFVAELLPAGTVALAGTTVARVVPPYASDVLAYAPPEGMPVLSASSVPFTVMLADGRECHGQGIAQTTGEVTAKPGQLVGPGGFAGFGFPISIALDRNCRLPVGQIVELRLGTP